MKIVKWEMKTEIDISNYVRCRLIVQPFVGRVFMFISWWNFLLFKYSLSWMKFKVSILSSSTYACLMYLYFFLFMTLKLKFIYKHMPNLNDWSNRKMSLCHIKVNGRKSSCFKSKLNREATTMYYGGFIARAHHKDYPLLWLKSMEYWQHYCCCDTRTRIMLVVKLRCNDSKESKWT